MSANELNDQYEQLRLCVTDGGSGGGGGLVVIRRQGLHAWIVHVTTAPRPQRSETPAASAFGPIEATIDQSPLVCLCADMLVATLFPQEV